MKRCGLQSTGSQERWTRPSPESLQRTTPNVWRRRVVAFAPPRMTPVSGTTPSDLVGDFAQVHCERTATAALSTQRGRRERQLITPLSLGSRKLPSRPPTGFAAVPGRAGVGADRIGGRRPYGWRGSAVADLSRCPDGCGCRGSRGRAGRMGGLGHRHRRGHGAPARAADPGAKPVPRAATDRHRRRVLAEAEEAGQKLSGAEVAPRLGLSPKTWQRLVNAAAESLKRAAPATGPRTPPVGQQLTDRPSVSGR